MAAATLTNKVEPIGSWLTELMDRFVRESEVEFGVTHLPVLLAETVEQFMLEITVQTFLQHQTDELKRILLIIM